MYFTNHFALLVLSVFLICSCSSKNKDKEEKDKVKFEIELGAISNERTIGNLDFLPTSEENMKFGFDVSGNLIALLEKGTQLEKETFQDISYKFRQDSEGMRLILVCKGKAIAHAEEIAAVLEKDFEEKKSEKLNSL
ncbi:hypothetical protein ACE193_15670 [Bernardetia sp. OM2101]|uniref:hypothetical protein n=1 Tax=Bernardetia sp. OM2101 TaxID=3344876 RepID=UPI0035CEEDCB